MFIAYLVFCFIIGCIGNGAICHHAKKEEKFESSFKIDGKTYCFKRPCSMKKNLELRQKFANGRTIEPLGRYEVARYYVDNNTLEVTEI